MADKYRNVINVNVCWYIFKYPLSNRATSRRFFAVLENLEIMKIHANTQFYIGIITFLAMVSTTQINYNSLYNYYSVKRFVNKQLFYFILTALIDYSFLNQVLFQFMYFVPLSFKKSGRGGPGNSAALPGDMARALPI